METVKSIKVIAADVMTGTILDEDFKWYTRSPGQVKWSMEFTSREHALVFCTEKIKTYPNVEFWICEDGAENIRITNEKRNQ